MVCSGRDGISGNNPEDSKAEEWVMKGVLLHREMIMLVSRKLGHGFELGAF
jgi:hypothetical protein